MNLFDPASIDDHSRMLASHLPVGRIWSGGFDRDSNLGKLVRGLGIEYYRLQLQTQKIQTDFNIRQTVDLLDEWEKSVGIPDDCFQKTGTVEDRKTQVELKFSNFGGVQEVEDFVAVAELFGFSVKITPGGSVGTFPLTFPIPMFTSARDATHTIFVEILDYEDSEIGFPLEFPLLFSSGGTSFLKCIFEVLAPANVQVVFVPEGTI